MQFSFYRIMGRSTPWNGTTQCGEIRSLPHLGAPIFGARLAFEELSNLKSRISRFLNGSPAGSGREVSEVNPACNRQAEVGRQGAGLTLCTEHGTRVTVPNGRSKASHYARIIKHLQTHKSRYRVSDSEVARLTVVRRSRTSPFRVGDLLDFLKPLSLRQALNSLA